MHISHHSHDTAYGLPSKAPKIQLPREAPHLGHIKVHRDDVIQKGGRVEHHEAISAGEPGYGTGDFGRCVFRADGF